MYYLYFNYQCSEVIKRVWNEKDDSDYYINAFRHSRDDKVIYNPNCYHSNSEIFFLLKGRTSEMISQLQEYLKDKPTCGTLIIGKISIVDGINNVRVLHEDN